jgi:hypothetical protein
VRDSDYVVVVFGKVNNVPITFQLYSNCGFFFSLHTVGPKDLGQLGPNIFVPIHTVMSCIIITNYLINMWLSEYKGLFHLLLFPWLYIGPHFFITKTHIQIRQLKAYKINKGITHLRFILFCDIVTYYGH